MDMIYYFSIKDQLFHIDLDGHEIDANYKAVDIETYTLFFEKVNQGCLVLSVDAKIFSEPKPSAAHIWQEGAWFDPRTAEQIEEVILKSLKPLTRRQFKLVLLENNLLDQIENAISAIEDDKTRARIQIEYIEATEFHRSSEFVIYMCNLLGFSKEQVDQIWKDAMHI